MTQCRILRFSQLSYASHDKIARNTKQYITFSGIFRQGTVNKKSLKAIDSCIKIAGLSLGHKSLSIDIQSRS